MSPQRSPMFPPPWWIALDLVAVLALPFGLVAWFEPAHPLAAWLPAGAGLAMVVVGGVLLALSIVLLLRMAMERGRARRL